MTTLKFSQIEKNQLTERAMSQVTGGNAACGCGCAAAGKGGSSTAANDAANDAGGLHSPGMTQYRIYIQDAGWRVYWSY